MSIAVNCPWSLEEVLSTAGVTTRFCWPAIFHDTAGIPQPAVDRRVTVWNPHPPFHSQRSTVVSTVWNPQPPFQYPPKWGAADAEIKAQSGENTELKRSSFKAWSRSVYSRTCYAYCQWFLLCLFLSFRSIHLHFFQNLSWFLLC